MSETLGSRSLIAFLRNEWVSSRKKIQLVNIMREKSRRYPVWEESFFDIIKGKNDCHGEENYFRMQPKIHVRVSVLTHEEWTKLTNSVAG